MRILVKEVGAALRELGVISISIGDTDERASNANFSSMIPLKNTWTITGTVTAGEFSIEEKLRQIAAAFATPECANPIGSLPAGCVVDIKGGVRYFPGPIKLEAVGVDTDGVIKPIADLKSDAADGAALQAAIAWIRDHGDKPPSGVHADKPITSSPEFRVDRETGTVIFSDPVYANPIVSDGPIQNVSWTVGATAAGQVPEPVFKVYKVNRDYEFLSAKPMNLSDFLVQRERESRAAMTKEERRLREIIEKQQEQRAEILKKIGEMFRCDDMFASLDAIVARRKADSQEILKKIEGLRLKRPPRRPTDDQPVPEPGIVEGNVATAIQEPMEPGTIPHLSSGYTYRPGCIASNASPEEIEQVLRKTTAIDLSDNETPHAAAIQKLEDLRLAVSLAEYEVRKKSRPISEVNAEIATLQGRLDKANKHLGK